jgi:hypothetical protein
MIPPRAIFDLREIAIYVTRAVSGCLPLAVELPAMSAFGKFGLTVPTRYLSEAGRGDPRHHWTSAVKLSRTSSSYKPSRP